MIRNITIAVAALLLSAAVATQPSTSPSSSNPEVLLESCSVKVVGTWSHLLSPSPNSSTTTRVRQFKGIPYASAPKGALRFSPTVDQQCPIASSSSSTLLGHAEAKKAITTFNATEFGNICIQPGDGPDGVMGDEDCLTLNIYVPEALELTATAPVLVYIHGGSLTGGSGIWEDLRFLAAFASGSDDVVSAQTSAVVVTINYRLGVLGFLAASSMCTGSALQAGQCGNFGIQDQVSALRWVRKYISYFGGDRDRVNLMGQSSGGTSIFALMGTPSAQGLFRSGVSLSGSPNITMGLTQKVAQDASIVASLNCTSEVDQLACLRALDSHVVQAAMPNSWNTPALFTNWMLNNASFGGEDYAGLAFVDGVTIPAPVWDSFKTGMHPNVTLVFGNMGQENGGGYPDHPLFNYTEQEWLSLLQNTLLSTWPTGTAERVYELYQNASTLANPQLASDSFNADYGLTCATYAILQDVRPLIAHTRTAPLYVYVNQWGPQNPDDGNTIPYYAYHTWDYVNACHNWDSSYVVGPDDYELSQLQRRQWFSLWVNGTFSKELEWPAALDRDTPSSASPMFYLFAKESRYPFRPRGATEDPYVNPGLCSYLIGTMGMNQRYWWCN